MRCPPAGGVIAGTELAHELGLDDFVTSDIGGTSADLSLISRRELRLATMRDIDAQPLRRPTACRCATSAIPRRPLRDRGPLCAVPRHDEWAMSRWIKGLQQPSYVLGRFRTVRRGYAVLRRAAQIARLDRSPLMLSDMYQDDVRPVPVTDRGGVSSESTEREHVDSLARDGYSVGLRLGAEEVAAIVRAARAAELGVVGESRTFHYDELASEAGLQAQIPMASVVRSCVLPEVERIAGDPLIGRVVAAHLGYQPRRVGSWLVWSFTHEMPMRRREEMYQTVRFHFDVHGINFIYVSFYLTDTDPDSGAHVVIRGSHRKKRLNDVLRSARISDERALDNYGAAAQVPVVGPAGAGFFEDTSCYHKALPPRTRPRLLLQLRYT